MRSFTRRIAAPALALAVLHCDGTSGSTSIGPPVEPTLDLVLNICPAEAPEFVAVQNEGHPWTRVTLGSGGVTTVKVTNTVGLAITDDFFGSSMTLVVYASAAEANTLFATAACVPSSGGKTLTGTVSGLSSQQAANIQLGSAFGFAFGSSPTLSYTMTNVPSGALDLLAFRQSSGVSDKFIVRRQLNLANGSSIPLLDFAASEAVAAATGSVTLSGLGDQESGEVFLEFRSAGGTEYRSFGSPTALRGVPATLTQPGDVHVMGAITQSNSGSSSRQVTEYHRDLGNHVIAFGPELGTATLSTAAVFPSRRMRIQIASQSEYGAVASALFGQENAVFVVLVTSAYLGGTPALWTLEMPELSLVPGFPPGATMSGGGTLGWSIQASSAFAGFSEPLGTDGTVIKSAQLTAFPDGLPSGISGVVRDGSLRFFGTMRGRMMPQKTR